MKYKFFLFLIIFNYLSYSSPMAYIYHGPETANDKRYEFEWTLLKEALEITRSSYGNYVLKPSKYQMNGLRRDLELEKDSGILTVILGIGTEEREKNLLPVRIPLDKGLLGYRIFIINKANQSNFLQINTLKDLQKYKVGQQLGWGDIEVWKANGFKVETVNNYEGLFNVLLSGRYDIFPRGILEAENEINSRKAKMPDLAIEKKLMVYYPWPRYFFFSKSNEGRKLAERVEKGLMKLIETGKYEKIFQQYNGDIIKKISLEKRKIIELKNPLLSDKTPLDNKKLWYKF